MVLSLAFFGLVQHLLVRDRGGGIHLVGSSSSGKSTIAECAVSVWGGPRLKPSWNAKINGLEAIAAALNGTVLVLDEIGEAVRQAFEDWLDAQGDDQNDLPERHLERIIALTSGNQRVHKGVTSKIENVLNWVAPAPY